MHPAPGPPPEERARRPCDPQFLEVIRRAAERLQYRAQDAMRTASLHGSSRASVTADAVYQDAAEVLAALERLEEPRR